LQLFQQRLLAGQLLLVAGEHRREIVFDTPLVTSCSVAESPVRLPAFILAPDCVSWKHAPSSWRDNNALMQHGADVVLIEVMSAAESKNVSLRAGHQLSIEM
jgi:hypothetical protein